jgi:hypothetical protein
VGKGERGRVKVGKKGRGLNVGKKGRVKCGQKGEGLRGEEDVNVRRS